MIWFNNLTVRNKLLASFGVVIALCTIILGAGIIGLREASDRLEFVFASNVKPLVVLGTATKHVAAHRRRVGEILLREGDAKTESVGKLKSSVRSADSAIAAYGAFSMEPTEKRLYQSLRASWALYLIRADSAIQIDLAGNEKEAEARQFGSVREAYYKAEGALDSLTAHNLAQVEEQKVDGVTAYERSRLLMLAAFALAIVFVGALVVVLSRSIAAPVAAIAGRVEALRNNCVAGLEDALARMAVGDLSAQVTPATKSLEHDSKDEIGQLAGAFNAILAMVVRAIHSFEGAQTAVRTVVQETEELGAAGRAGRLDARGDLTRHAGAYRDVVAGFNATLDAVIAPINEAADVLQQVSEGDLTVRVRGEYAGDHAKIKASLNTAAESMQQAFLTIAGSAEALASSSEELSATASEMGKNAERTSEQANVVAAAADEVSRNAQTVASGTEEMGASIREIAKNAADAARVANEAVDVADRTSATMQRLDASSTAIGEVVQLITEIAEQTNLLALNATIEAARAGEAGKGFAVVANEVKELAKATARATGEIKAQVTAIQSDTADALHRIGEVAIIIGQISDIQSTIAGAVEEQSATAQEMSRNVSQAAVGVGEIAENITGVARAAVETTDAAQASGRAAHELARLSTDLQVLVGNFNLHGHDAVASPASRLGSFRDAVEV